MLFFIAVEIVRQLYRHISLFLKGNQALPKKFINKENFIIT